MRLLLTCGPSYEPIDDVRRITNFSTGALGMRLASTLAAAGHEVTCFKGVGATTHEGAGAAKVMPFSTNDDLLARLAAIEQRDEVGAFLHVAALADFKVRRDGGERKMSSRAGEITLTLVPAAKVISRLRGLFPRARIVGWKYELDGTREEALAKGARQLAENGTEACVVNGAAYGRGFGVVRAGEPLVALEDAEALSAWLVAWLEKEQGRLRPG
jgi:phosphopantothenoylcysteine synthetase/decarboxylase